MPSSSSSVRSAGAPVLVDGGGAAREDQRPRVAEPDPLDVGVVRQQLREDPALAEPPRDQLRVLAAEVEHEDLLAIDADRARLAAPRDRRSGASIGCSSGSASVGAGPAVTRP